jgi:hypothetical protein
MKQIAKAIRLFTDNLKFYIIVGLIVVLVPSFAMSQNLVPKQDNENKTTEEVVPKVAPPRPNTVMPYGTIFMLKKPITCNDTPVIKNFIENINGMMPIIMGTDKNQMGVITSLVQLYANPITDTFVVVEHFAIAKSCIIFQGHDFKIILPDRYYEGPTQDD